MRLPLNVAENQVGLIRDIIVKCDNSTVKLRPKPRGIYFIYAFEDPDTLETFYVGCSGNPFRRLLLAELQPRRQAVGRKVKALACKGRYPIIRILERVDARSRVERERWWIQLHVDRGSPLLNRVVAGTGAVTPRLSNEQRKMRGKLIAYKEATNLSFSKLTKEIGLGDGRYSAMTLHRFMVQGRTIQATTTGKIRAFLKRVSGAPLSDSTQLAG